MSPVLGPARVIDLTDEGGLLCGQILADLGADVIQVEPPGGSSARLEGPWLEGRPGSERSLFWWAYARGKRSVVLDVEDEDDRETLLRLARGADFWLESDTPGRLAALGLGYEDLTALNPSLVYVSISPFGQTGPKAGYASSDLTAMASGGALYLSGETDSPPLRVQVPQAHAHAGADAAAGALLAHFARKRTGRGQHVDVSTQQSVTLATMFRSLDAPLAEASARRVSGGAIAGGVLLRTRYEAADGWVTLGPCFLPSTGHFMNRLLAWIGEDHDVDPGLLEENWGLFALNLIRGEREKGDWLRAETLLDRFFRTRTKAELMAEAVKRKLLLAPIFGLDELIASPQLAERDFMCSVARPDGEGRAHYPGPFARFSESPLHIERSAPRRGEHDDEVRRELQRSPAYAAPVEGPQEALPELPLAGVKIVDFFWVLAGPGATRLLADYGAHVIRVESTKKIDTLRVIPPYQFNNPHPEGSGAFHSANVNKQMVSLDLTHPEGREIALDLVRWADVSTESFSPGVMEQYGLGADALLEVNPELIQISSTLMGQSGPWRDFTGFGNLAASVTGFQQLASWPGEPPSGPYGAYTDFLSARFNAIAILAALEHRDRTGEGQLIDQSQAEAALHFLTPAFLDFTVNGRASVPRANTDWHAHPHGVYRCAGQDRWIAIAVRSDAEWRALCEALGRRTWISRRDDTAAVEEALASWIEPLDAADLEARLQEKGVPAHAVLDTPDLFGEASLLDRGHFQEVSHEIYGSSWVESSRLLLSETPARLPTEARAMGVDNRAVLEGVLGHSAEQIADWAARGILS